MRRFLVSAVVALAVFVAPASSHALTWSAPFALAGRDTDVDLGDPPQIALNARGDMVAAWVGAHGYALALGDRRHGFSRPLSAGVDAPQVAMGAKGRALVVGVDLTDDDRSVFAVLPRSGGRAAAHGLATPDAVGAALGDGSFVVVHRTRATLKAVHVSPFGRPGRAVVVSTSASSEDDLQVVQATDGSAVVCCGAHASTTTAWRTGDGTRWSSVAYKPAKGEYADSFAAGPGVTVFAGSPALEVLRAGREPRRVVLGAPDSSTVKAATVDGAGRPVVIYADRGTLSGVALDGADAAGTPVALGPIEDFDYDATVAAPLGAGAIVAWPSRGRWHVASEQGGAFAPAPAPAGSPALGRLVSAGNVAALAWYGFDHRAHVAVARP